MKFPDHIAASAREVIQAVKSGHYPDAVAILLYGSVLEGTATAASDIDLFIVTPHGDDLHERRLIKNDVCVQCTAVPENALEHLPRISRQARRPVGIIGFAHGQLIDGDIPDLPALKDACQSALRDVNQFLKGTTERNLRTAIDTAESANARQGPGRIALGLRAVPMLLEVELQFRADDHNSSRSQYRRIAEAHPDLVDQYAEIGQAVASGDTALLMARVAKLKANLAPVPANAMRRRLSLEKLLAPPRR